MTLLKRIIHNSIQGIGIACTLYLLSGMVFDYLNQGTLIMENWAFSRQAIGALLVGIGFSAPTEIYRCENLPFPLKFLFHMGIGCTVYTIVGLYVNWIPVQLGWERCTLIIFLQFFTAFLIWIGHVLYYRMLARDINQKIQEKEKES